MINFFRKIRRKFQLDEKKGKFLKYVGVIVVVAIIFRVVFPLIWYPHAKLATNSIHNQKNSEVVYQHNNEIVNYFEFLGRLFLMSKDTVSFGGTISLNNRPTFKNPRRQVFGFHPYWMGEEYENYNYKLLSSVSYFAYELNPETGNYRDYKRIEDWRTTPLITLAKDQGCKVYLTVTNLKKEDNKVFLSNTNAQTNSIRIIADLLVGREASGVVINFEDVPKVLKDQYTSYILELSGQLRAQGMTVIITLPPIPNSSFNVKVLNNFVEYFIVMGKNYYDKQSKIAGPVAPLRSGSLWTSGSLENSIEAYLSLGIPDNKIILSLPYYGSKWKTVDSSIPSKKMKFEEYLKYKTIKKRYTKKPKYDSISETAYLNFIENGEHTQIWFDDARTMGKKYDIINEKRLAGVGIWALGYDNGHDELWEVLGEKFGTVKEIFGPVRVSSFLSYISVLKVILFLVIFVSFVGFLVSLRYKTVRAAFAKKMWFVVFALNLSVFLTLIIGVFMNSIWIYYFITFFLLICGVRLMEAFIKILAIKKTP